MMKAVLLLSALVGLSGCVQTTELPLASNVVRLESEGDGLVGASRVTNETLKRAAEATLARGYTHFILQDVGRSRDTQFIGMTPGSATTNATFMGNSGFATTTYNPGVPMYSTTTSVGATVIMFRADEPGAAGALVAQDVLASLEQ